MAGGDVPTFSLERFDWGAPDRLEVSGAFSGVSTGSLADPVLVVRGHDGEHRLPVVAAEASGAGWQAAFAWTRAPVPFDRALLKLGDGLAVDLPAPGAAAPGPLAVLGAPQAGPANGAADIEARLRQGLDTVRASAEAALGAVAEARSRAQEQARAEVEELRRRIAELEPAAAELEATRRELERVQAELDAARSTVADARAGVQALLDRLARAEGRSG